MQFFQRLAEANRLARSLQACRWHKQFLEWFLELGKVQVLVQVLELDQVQVLWSWSWRWASLWDLEWVLEWVLELGHLWVLVWVPELGQVWVPLMGGPLSSWNA